jgi:hypothetical protein
MVAGNADKTRPAAAPILASAMNACSREGIVRHGSVVV